MSLDRSLRARIRSSVRACTRMHLNPREFACVHTHKNKHSFLCAFACMRLCACSRAGLIKMQNAVARKKSQNSNALCVQKLSGCTIASLQRGPCSILPLPHYIFTLSPPHPLTPSLCHPFIFHPLSLTPSPPYSPNPSLPHFVTSSLPHSITLSHSHTHTPSPSPYHWMR